MKKNRAMVRSAERVLAWFRTTYKLYDGRRVCLVCGAEQYDFPSGHASNCVVDSAMATMSELIHGLDVGPASRAKK